MAYRVKERPVESIDSVPIEQITEKWFGYIPDHPFTSEEFCRQNRPDDDLELISGIAVQRPMVNWNHEQCQMWLSTVINGYVSALRLGVVAGSRTALEINPFQVRLPDLMFLRSGNPAKIRQRGIRGVPDLLIEIVSPSDRRGDLLSRETDYRTLGASEIVFIDQQRKSVRIIRKDVGGYTTTDLKSGDIWRPQSISNFALDVEWLLNEPRPSPNELVNRLLASAYVTSGPEEAHD